MAFYDLDGRTRRAIALDELVMAVQVETIERGKAAGAGDAGRWRLLAGEDGRLTPFDTPLRCGTMTIGCEVRAARSYRRLQLTIVAAFLCGGCGPSSFLHSHIVDFPPKFERHTQQLPAFVLRLTLAYQHAQAPTRQPADRSACQTHFFQRRQFFHRRP